MDLIEQGTLSKKEVIRNFLLKELRSGKYPAGERFLSENRLIDEFGFCKNTVREAFSSLVEEGLLERVRGKGTFVLDPSRSESANRSRTVHLVIGDPLSKHENDPFVGNILTGLHAALDACGRRIRVSLVDKPARTELEVEKVLNEAAAADSVILAGLNYPRELTDEIRRRGHKLVTIGLPEDTSVPYVHGDAGELITRVLDELFRVGHRKIAFADRRATHLPSFLERRQGYLRFMDEHGLVPDARLLVEYSSFDLAAGPEIWSQLTAFSAEFSAIVVYGDWATYGVIQAAAADGKLIPRDLSLISICGTPLFTSELQITRCGGSSFSFGKAAGELLLAVEAGEETDISRILPSVFFEGNSVRSLDNAESR